MEGDYDANTDAEELKSLITSKKEYDKIIKLLTSRTNSQRQKI